MTIKRQCFLNNLTMRGQRKREVYQAIIIDLGHKSLIDKSKAIKLLGYEQDPINIKTPVEGRI